MIGYLKKIGAKSLDIRRAFFVENPSAGYPAYTYTKAFTADMGRSPGLTDEEWVNVLQKCFKYFSKSSKRIISLGEVIKYDSFILSDERLV